MCQAVEVLQRQAFLKHNSYLKAETDVKQIMNESTTNFHYDTRDKGGRKFHKKLIQINRTASVKKWGCGILRALVKYTVFPVF